MPNGSQAARSGEDRPQERPTAGMWRPPNPAAEAAVVGRAAARPAPNARVPFWPWPLSVDLLADRVARCPGLRLGLALAVPHLPFAIPSSTMLVILLATPTLTLPLACGLPVCRGGIGCGLLLGRGCCGSGGAVVLLFSALRGRGFRGGVFLLLLLLLLLLPFVFRY